MLPLLNICQAESMRRFSMFAGMFSVACGSFMIWMAYCFASMIDPDVQGIDRQSEILHGLTTQGASPVALGILLICVGAWLAISKPKRSA